MASSLKRALGLVLVVASVVSYSVTEARAGELAGVSMKNTKTVDGESLVLNGMALRKKAIFKVYVAGLYLPAKESSSEKILAADQPRILDLEFVRTVGKESLSGAWNDCLASGSPNAGKDVEAGFKTLGGWMKDVKAGDRIGFTYRPSKGVTVEVKGKASGEIEGKDFADALFRCWIGPVPPSAGFKAGLLGG